MPGRSNAHRCGWLPPVEAGGAAGVGGDAVDFESAATPGAPGIPAVFKIATAFARSRISFDAFFFVIFDLIAKPHDVFVGVMRAEFKQHGFF
jgi:hypothetical protein